MAILLFLYLVLIVAVAALVDPFVAVPIIVFLVIGGLLAVVIASAPSRRRQ